MGAKAKNESIGRGRTPRYPWGEWFSRASFTLRQGVDYENQSYVMAQQVRNAAKRYRTIAGVHLVIENERIVVTVIRRKTRA